MFATIRSARLAIRMASRATLRVPVAAIASPRLATLSTARTFSVSVSARYSSPSDRSPISGDEIFGSDDPNSPMTKIKNSPAVLKVLVDIGEMLQAKGYVVPGESVGMWTMLKMLKDKDFQGKLRERK